MTIHTIHKENIDVLKAASAKKKVSNFLGGPTTLLVDRESRLGQRFPLALSRSVKNGRKLTTEEIEILETVTNIDWANHALRIGEPRHRSLVARAVDLGAIMFYGFGNFTAVAAQPHVEVVKYVNRLKGRPEGQVGSVTTTRDRIPKVFAWQSLPDKLSFKKVMALMDAFYELGPFGFLGPAAPSIPGHLSNWDRELGVNTTQIIAPGYNCPSNELLEEILTLTGGDYLFITSTNLSRHETGHLEEPAHFEMRGIQEDFGRKRAIVMIAHDDEETRVAAYPRHLPMSTSILDFHNVDYDAIGRPQLTVVRHGSLHIDDIQGILEKHGFGLKVSERAKTRLPIREY